jgi:hypothetical protein
MREGLQRILRPFNSDVLNLSIFRHIISVWEVSDCWIGDIWKRLKFCGTVFEQKRKSSGAVPPEKKHRSRLQNFI